MRRTPCLCKVHRFRAVAIGFVGGAAFVTHEGETLAGPFDEMWQAEAWLREQPVYDACRAPYTLPAHHLTIADVTRRRRPLHRRTRRA